MSSATCTVFLQRVMTPTQVRLVGSHRSSGRWYAPACPPPGGKEGFYVLEGEITFQIGEDKVVATAGMFANIPVGVAPAGLEQMFFEVGVRLAEGVTTALPPTKDEIEKLLAVAPNYGIEIRLLGH